MKILTTLSTFGMLLMVGAVLLKGSPLSPLVLGSQETITVMGSANQETANQLASFTAGVNAVDDDKDAAVKEVQQKIDDLVSAVKKFGIPAEDIKTATMSIYQREETYYDDGPAKTRKGQWSVDNTVEITLREVARANELASLLAGSGATNVYGPNFRTDTSKQEDANEDMLSQKALENATLKAETLALKSGRRLGKVLTISEAGTQPPMIYAMAERAMGGGGGPGGLEPGTSTSYKSLTVTFELK